MAKKISELTAVSSLSGTEQVEVNQSGTSKRTTTQDIANMALRKATVELTDAQIKALPTTGIEVVAAPGSGKMIHVVSSVVSANITAVYTTVVEDWPNSYLQLSINSVARMLFTQGWLATETGTGSIIGIVDEIIGVTTTAPSFNSGLDNQPLMFSSENQGSGNFDDGNAANTLTITVYYVIVDI